MLPEHGTIIRPKANIIPNGKMMVFCAGILPFGNNIAVYIHLESVASILCKTSTACPSSISFVFIRHTKFIYCNPIIFTLFYTVSERESERKFQHNG